MARPILVVIEDAECIADIFSIKNCSFNQSVLMCCDHWILRAQDENDYLYCRQLFFK